MDRDSIEYRDFGRQAHHILLWLAATTLCMLPANAVAQDDQGNSWAKLDVLPDAIFEPQVLGFDVWRLVLAGLIILVGVAARESLIRRLVTPVRALFDRTDTRLDDLILEETRGPLSWLIAMLAVYVGLRLLELPNHVDQSTDVIARTLGIFLAAWFLFRVLDVGLYALEEFTEDTESKVDNQLVPVVRRIARLFLLVIAVLVAIQQWGYNVSSLIAGLGIGGLAFALAARNMLSNWFGALMIFTDRPFKIDDWVETDYGTGAIEEVGLRSTRIRTYGRERIIVPNAKMASDAVTNVSVHDRRQISAEIGLVYSTTHEQLTDILENIRSLLDEHEAIWDGDWRAFFVGFGEDALQIEVSCFTNDPDLTHWREVRQELFLEFMRIVEEAGSEFAHPTRSVFLEGQSDEPEPETSDSLEQGRSPETDG